MIKQKGRRQRLSPKNDNKGMLLNLLKRNPRPIVEKRLRHTQWLTILGLLAAATIPNLYSKGPNADKSYEKSLFSEYSHNANQRQKRDWIIFNNMLYDLAKGISDFGVNGQNIKKHLAELGKLNVMDDSARVAEIYENIFLNYDTKLDRKPGDKNSFISEELIKNRFPQIITYHGYDTHSGKLTDWGHLIALQGLEEPVGVGESHIEAVALGDGLTYRAEEDSDGVYRLDVNKTHRGPTSLYEVPEDPFSNGSSSNAAVGQDGMESRMLTLMSEHLMYIHTPYPVLQGIRDIRLFRYPSSNNISIDIYGNNRELRSGEVQVDYSVYDKQAGKVLDAKSGRTNILKSTGKKDGFAVRIFTAALPVSNSYEVSVKVTNNDGKKESYCTSNQLVEINEHEYPLEILDLSIPVDSGAVPFFLVEPVERGRTFRLFFYVEGLSKIDSSDAVYSGVANVFLFDPEEKANTEIRVGDIENLYWQDSLFPEPITTLEDAVKPFRDKYLGAFPLTSAQTHAYCSMDVAIPEFTSVGIKVLYLEFYKIVNSESKAVKRIGYAQKYIQVM